MEERCHLFPSATFVDKKPSICTRDFEAQLQVFLQTRFALEKEECGVTARKYEFPNFLQQVESWSLAYDNHASMPFEVCACPAIVDDLIYRYTLQGLSIVGHGERGSVSITPGLRRGRVLGDVPD